MVLARRQAARVALMRCFVRASFADSTARRAALRRRRPTDADLKGVAVNRARGRAPEPRLSRVFGAGLDAPQRANRS
ncbi:hypothetical protein C0Z17_14230 [Trinickia caryophylli]|nr:hypothetical protein C0Z17_14230 [Trinickia caryophylli]